ncbi:MAG: acyltransferase [Bacteroidaceae bacterium]|nr:acyltransferase [Bacteroidaceae bacterium]MBR1683475.1 acyltransferase [Bacteroidaceae bacterium]MBR1800468.1 acyltransferase [Bacteroidaceae bacterium]
MTNDLLSRQQTNVLRGMAAIVIAVFHVLIAWQCHRVVNIMGSVSVAVFLVLSGFGIHESYQKNGLKDYWHKKFRRIIVPYWLFLAVVTLIKGFPGWKPFLLDACFIQSEFWFIPYLVQCYLVYWIIQRWLHRWMTPAFIIIGLIALNTMPQIAAEQSFSFFAGVLASQHIQPLRQKDKRFWFTVGALSFFIGVAFLLLKEIPAVHAYKGTLPYNYILLFIKLPLAIPFLLIPTFASFVVRSRTLYLAGISSLEIYLVHLPLVPYVEKTALHFILFMAATALLTWIYYQINHRIIAHYL